MIVTVDIFLLVLLVFWESKEKYDTNMKRSMSLAKIFFEVSFVSVFDDFQNALN